MGKPFAGESVWFRRLYLGERRQGTTMESVMHERDTMAAMRQAGRSFFDFQRLSRQGREKFIGAVQW
jgi:uncharacterized protein YaiI (UPF0178 family)